MRITRHQIRRMIAEAMPRGGAPDVVGATTGVPGGNIQNLVDEYKEWAVEYMGTPSGANSSSVLATFLVNKGLDQGAAADDIIADMADAMKFDQHDVNTEVTRARREYDAGKTLPEGKMRITKRQLRRLIREARNEPTAELTDPSISEEQISASWPEYVTHNGKNVFQTFYEGGGVMDAVGSFIEQEGYDDHQEGYLGYDPDLDVFVMGFDAFPGPDDDGYGDQYSDGGDMEGVLVELRSDGTPTDIITSVPGGMYPAGLREAKKIFPGILNVRLD
jgi:hypothetical protein